MKDNRYSASNIFAIKANQQWELAGMARQDGDKAAVEEHTRKARELEDRAKEYENNR